jgi:WD40 repeat protein
MDARTLYISLLGSFRLVYGDRPVTNVNTSPQLQTLLAYLVLHPERVHSRKQLAAILYPDLSEADARNRLRQTLYRLHQGFPEIAHFITSDSHTISWNTAAPYTLDVDHPAMQQLDPGELLPDLQDTWVQGKRYQLQQLYAPSTASPQTEELQPNSKIQPSTLNVQRSTDWGDAPDVSLFYGRETEFNTLQHWIEQDQCRFIALLGMGGIGKTALAVKVAQNSAQNFDLVLWRSLRNAPPIDTLLTELVPFLSRQQDTDIRLSRLIHWLRETRCLVILDNVETILQGGERVGQYRAGYENYGELFRLVAESSHQSCVMITSREKPAEVGMYEGMEFKVRSLLLSGSSEAAHAILASKGLLGTNEQKQQLCQLYSQNPLALKLVSSSIQELFDGEIRLFLEQNTVIFQSVRRLLDQQFQRLTELEQTVMYWLAINREWTSIVELEADIIPAVARIKLLEALESLRWRSLLERQSSRYTQQPVVMEYTTERLIKTITSELQTIQLGCWLRYALVKTTVKDYIRQTQERLIAASIAQQLQQSFSTTEQLEQQILHILATLRQSEVRQPGYGGGNLLNLCRHLPVPLTGYDFSHLFICQANLQNLNLHRVNFAHATFKHSMYTQAAGNGLVIKFSPDGRVLASGDDKRVVSLRRAETGQHLATLTDHTHWIWAIAFSPDGQLLASSGDDSVIRVWDTLSHQLLCRLSGHTNWVRSLAFSPDGQILASASTDRTIRLWHVPDFKQHKETVSELSQPLRTIVDELSNGIWAIAFSPDGETLASTSTAPVVKLWNWKTSECIQQFEGHENWVITVAFSPDGQLLASSGLDHTIKIWNIATGNCFQTLRGHTKQINAIAFNSEAPTFSPAEVTLSTPPGYILASGSNDQTVKLWNVQTGQCIRTLQEHTNFVWSVDFSPDGQQLVSSSDAQTIKLWDVQTGDCLRTLRGYINQVYSVAFVHSNLLVSGNLDCTVKLWDIKTGKVLRSLQGHTSWIWSVAIGAAGQLIASGSGDETVRLWDVHTGACLRILRGHTNRVSCVAFSLDSQIVASGSSDDTIKLWQVNSGTCLCTLQGHTSSVRSIAFSPTQSDLLASGDDDCMILLWDLHTQQVVKQLKGHTLPLRMVCFSPTASNLLASSGEDLTIRLWDVQTGQVLQILQGHSASVRTIAFSSDGQYLVSGSEDKTIKVWQVSSGQCLNTLYGHESQIWSVTIGGDNSLPLLASAGDDESIRLWNLKTGVCVQALRSDRPYEGMNITGVTGLTDAQKATLRALGAVDDAVEAIRTFRNEIAP